MTAPHTPSAAPRRAAGTAALRIVNVSGSTGFVFPVTLSATSGSPVTVRFVTSNGTADASTDYTAQTGTLVIAAGQVSTSITITVSGDTLYEAAETFTVNLPLADTYAAAFAGSPPYLRELLSQPAPTGA